MEKITAIYVRISMDRDGERAGVERQEADCRRLADELGLATYRLYTDNDVSAYTGKRRPAFEELMADAVAGKFSHLIIWAADRLYRRMADLERIVTTLEGRVQIHAVKSGDFDFSTADGRLTARMHGTIAQHSSEKASERIKAATQQRTAKGVMATGRLPIGWRWVDPCPADETCLHKPRKRADGTEALHEPDARPRVGSRAGLEPDPVTGPLLAKVYQDILDGYTLWAAAKRSTARGLPLTPSSLTSTLHTPRHGGLVALHGTVMGEAKDGHKIVSREVWEGATAMFCNPKKPKTKRGRAAKPILAGGIFKCYVCGGNMSSGGLQPNGHLQYKCTNHCRVRRMDTTDQQVLDAVGTVLTEVAAHDWVTLKAADHKGEMGAVRDEIRKLESNLSALAALMGAGDLDPADYAAAATRIRGRLAELTQHAAQRTGREAVGRLAADPHGVESAYTELRSGTDVEALRMLLLELIDQVTMDDARSLIIVWREWTGIPATVFPATGKGRRGNTPERQAEVVRLWQSGMNKTEIAAELGWSVPAIAGDLKRAERDAEKVA